jgi:hypothetical protein
MNVGLDAHDRRIDPSRTRMMALSVIKIEAPNRIGAALDWASIQWAQFEHDEKYHREISRLSVQDRLRHMALHFAKYAGRLNDRPSDDVVKKIAVDTLIIAISCANILNIDLSKQSLLALGSADSKREFSRLLSVAAGKMASACERLDHLEEFPFRTAIAAEVLTILSACIGLFETEGWDLAVEREERLGPIKAKSIFHGKL